MENGKYVLIVEDDADAAEVTCDVVEWLGYRSVVAHRGKDAIRIAREVSPEIVLLDLGLPDARGPHVARALRDGAGPGALSIIAVTGFSAPEMLEAAYGAGVDDVVVKPVTIASLRDALARARPRTAA